MSDFGPAVLASRLGDMNLFREPSRKDDEDDLGEEIDARTVGGGGHSARPTEVTRHQLRVSHALRSFLVNRGVLTLEDAGLASEEPTWALRHLLDKPYINVPPQVTERSYSLPEYFVSSSHNTYLMAHQLYGTSAASAYEAALSTGSRCVEIDAWDNVDYKEEPKVTHGYTLVSHIPFRAVCETIRDVVDREASQARDAQGIHAAPIFIALENHCDAHGQLRLVEIMKEVWGDRLLSKDVRRQGHEEQDCEGGDNKVTLDQLGSKIVVIVEYHLPNESDSSDSDDASGNEDDGQREARLAYKQKKKDATSMGIIPELAALGLYAQSVKPTNSSWFEDGALENGPRNHLINVSEVGLAAHMPANNAKIGRHNAQHLMRVFPKGTRISSRNFQPVPFWGLGAQICALNWQTFGASMQLNDALFSGTDGFVLKPAALRPGGSGVPGTGRRRLLRLHVAGATDVPLPKDRGADDIRPYLTCTLVQPGQQRDKPPKCKTTAYKHHKLGFLHHGENPPATDPVWDEVLEWEFEDTELDFLRLMVKSDDSFARNPIFAVAAVRLLYAAPGWSFIRMLDLKGRETRCSLLVQFEFEEP